VASASLGFVVVPLDISVVNAAPTRIGAALSTDVAGLQRGSAVTRWPSPRC